MAVLPTPTQALRRFGQKTILAPAAPTLLSAAGHTEAVGWRRVSQSVCCSVTKLEWQLTIM